jgi:D-3-phosphoglycerate dehydrogenase / 2-oxoglutarate reductase
MSRPVVMEVLPAMTPRVNELLREHVEVRTASRPDPQALIQEAQGAVALIARVVDLPYRIGGDIFDRVPSIQVVTATGSGADCYDIQAASDRGIPVLHNPGIAARPVVEYVLGSIVLLTRRLLDHSHYLSSGGDWNDRARFVGPEVAECTLGLVGLGAIGGEVARRARLAFDMPVRGFDPFVPDERFHDLNVERCDSLQSLLTDSDVLSLHVPLLSSTAGLIGRQELAMMKPTASLINASRGAIVDEAALTVALTNGTIAGAVVDVFEDERPDPGNPLFRLPNVLATPHCAGVSASGGARLAEATAGNLLRALAGERPPHLVNPDAWPPRRGKPVL